MAGVMIIDDIEFGKAQAIYDAICNDFSVTRRAAGRSHIIDQNPFIVRASLALQTLSLGLLLVED
jgi:hypothetical protein